MPKCDNCLKEVKELKRIIMDRSEYLYCIACIKYDHIKYCRGCKTYRISDRFYRNNSLCCLCSGIENVYDFIEEIEDFDRVRLFHTEERT